VSLARRKRRASVNKVNKPAGRIRIPGLSNPIVAREIDKLEPGADESINLVRLRDELDKTRAMIVIKSERLLHILGNIERKFGKELSSFLLDKIVRRAEAALILDKWLDGELPSGVKIVIDRKGDRMYVEYVNEYMHKAHIQYWKIASDFFSPDATIQEVIDWFIHNRDVFEYMVDEIGTATGVYVDKLEFIDWLKKNNIPLDDPNVKEALGLFYELYNHVDRFNSLIDELRTIIGWKKEEEEEQ
jgi:hypothetical protein